MEDVGARVRVRLLRARGDGGGGGGDGGGGGGSRKRRRDDDGARAVQTQWLRGSVEAFRPTTGKHLVVFDIVYGRCVRGNVVTTELGVANDVEEKPLPKDAYRQNWLDRRAVLVAPCNVRSAGLVCQPWARCVYFDACICNEASPLLGARTDWPAKGVESPSDAVSRSLRWAVWVDIAALAAAGVLQRIESLPLVCICRLPQLPDGDPAANGELTTECARCAQRYHLDCVVDRAATAAAPKSEDSNRQDSGDDPQSPLWTCPFCKARKLAGVPERGPDSQKDTGHQRDPAAVALAHLKSAPPSSLETVREWRFWNVPLSQGGKVAEDLPVPKGEWVYTIRHLRHLCGAERKHFMRVELGAIAAQPHHRCPRRGLEVLPYGKGALAREAERRRVLLGDAGRNFPCTTGGTARLLSLQAGPLPAAKIGACAPGAAASASADPAVPAVSAARIAPRRSGHWKPAGEGHMENIMRRMACETLPALEGGDPPARFAVKPSGKLVMHSPRGGYLGERESHLEVEFSAGAYSAAPPLGDHEGGVTADGTRYVRAQVGAAGTPAFTCARLRPRSEADHRRSAARPCPVVGPAAPDLLPLRGLYRSDKLSSRARGAASTFGAGSTRAAAGPTSLAALLSGGASSSQARASSSRMAGSGGGGDASSKRRLQLRGVAEVLSADMSTKHLTLGREKRLRFGKSPIHAWGVFAEEPLGANEFVIEYKGELIRPILTDLREKQYEARGVPDYMFRIDADVVVDATLRGSLARFINHSCDPNCFTSIINHKGTRKIVIYAKRAIEPGEELSYDYKFPIEKDPALKVPCFCGAPNCRGTMN